MPSADIDFSHAVRGSGRRVSSGAAGLQPGRHLSRRRAWAGLKPGPVDMRRAQKQAAFRVVAMCIALVTGTAWLGAQAAPAAGQAAPPAAEKTAALPSARSIIDRYITAIGGKAAVKKPTSRFITGRFELPAQGMGGPFEISAAAPDRMLLKITLQGLGEMARGYDGQVGWAIDPAIGPRLLVGGELDEVRYSADFYSDLYEPSSFTSMRVVERAPFEGRDCYTVQLVRRSGLELTEYFNVDDGLKRGTRMNSTSPMGTVPGVVTVLDGYRDFGGVKVPTTARQKAMGVESVLTIERVEYDRVPADAFALPPPIAALVKGK